MMLSDCILRGVWLSDKVLVVIYLRYWRLKRRALKWVQQ